MGSTANQLNIANGAIGQHGHGDSGVAHQSVLAGGLGIYWIWSSYGHCLFLVCTLAAFNRSSRRDQECLGKRSRRQIIHVRGDYPNSGYEPFEHAWIAVRPEVEILSILFSAPLIRWFLPLIR